MIFLQWLKEEEEGFRGALATKLKEALPCSRSANLKEQSTSTLFSLCKSVGSRTFILLSMYRLC
jgi:hypothetical protein